MSNSIFGWIDPTTNSIDSLASSGVSTNGPSFPDAIARFDDSTGKILKNSTALLFDSGLLQTNAVSTDNLREKTVGNGVDIELCNITDGLVSCSDADVQGTVSANSGSFTSDLTCSTIKTNSINENTTNNGITINNKVNLNSYIKSVNLDNTNLIDTNTFQRGVGTTSGWIAGLFGPISGGAGSIAMGTLSGFPTITGMSPTLAPAPLNIGSNSPSSDLALAGFNMSLNSTTGVNVIGTAVPSTSNTTGQLRLLGGMGCGGNINAGGSIRSTNATASTSSSTGAIVASAGGFGCSGRINCDSFIRSVNSDTLISVNTSSFRRGNGAVSNGWVALEIGSNSTAPVSQGNKILLGNNSGNCLIQANTNAHTAVQPLTIEGSDLTLKAPTVQVNSINGLRLDSTIEATNLSTGSLQSLGGASIAKNVYVGGKVNILNTDDTSSSTTGCLVVSGGIGCAKGLHVQQELEVVGAVLVGDAVYSNGIFSSTSSNQATANGTGAIQAPLGGISCAKSIFTNEYVIASSAPVLGSHLCNKTYVDNVISQVGRTSFSTAWVGVLNRSISSSNSDDWAYYTRTGKIVQFHMFLDVGADNINTVTRYSFTLPQPMSIALGSDNEHLIGDGLVTSDRRERVFVYCNPAVNTTTGFIEYFNGGSTLSRKLWVNGSYISA